MVVPAHVGIEHPNLLWIVVVGIAAFAAGLAVDLVRSSDADGRPDAGSDESAE